MIVVAPTGVAAINAGGVTIHSFFQLPFHPHVPTQYLAEAAAVKAPPEAGSYKMSRDKIRIIKGLDLLVIDEISMVRADLLDAVDNALRRYKDKTLPFGGVQLLMIGDIQQLAPVAKQEEWELLEQYYDTPFFFGSLALRSTNYVTIELRHIYRQQDQHFIELLNKIRDNKIDSVALELLNKRYNPALKPGDQSGYITLTTHNSQAQSINEKMLNEIPSPEKKFTAEIEGEFPEYAYPTFSELILKAGAQVMFVKNDISKDKLFFNGKIGIIEGFEEKHIMVKCPGESVIPVERAEWQNMKYSLNEETKEIDETAIGKFFQYPLKLAWAITIHKSQGLTFDKAIIDARAAFAHGQVYVALSRCRTLDGLVLSTPISRNCVISDPAVTGFVREAEKNRPDEKTLTDSRRTYQNMLIADLFDFTPLIRGIYYTLKIIQEHHESIVGNPELQVQNLISYIRKELLTVSEKFSVQLNNLLKIHPDAESNDQLQDRISKACEYFSGKMMDLRNALGAFNVETDNKGVKKSVTESLDKLVQDAEIKLACLEKCKQGFNISVYNETKARAALSVPDLQKPKTRQQKSISDTSGAEDNPVLYNRIRKWRDAKAAEADLPVYMILPAKTIATITTVMPRTLEGLRQIKGMGSRKSEQYGEEIITIIKEYCSQKKIEPGSYVPKKEAINAPVNKRPTREISLGLFREGKSIQEIARLRDMAPTTIEGHLSEFIATGDLSVTDLISPDLTEMISEQFQKQDTMQMGPVKAALGDDISWSEIRFVAKHLEYLRNKEQ
jgi:hypothetical protein